MRIHIRICTDFFHVRHLSDTDLIQILSDSDTGLRKISRMFTRTFVRHLSDICQIFHQNLIRIWQDISDIKNAIRILGQTFHQILIRFSSDLSRILLESCQILVRIWWNVGHKFEEFFLKKFFLDIVSDFPLFFRFSVIFSVFL